MAAGNSTDTCAHDDSGGGGLGEVLAGVAIAVVASVGINIGNNIQALGLKMRIAAKGKEETDSKAASCKPGDGDMQLEEITGDVETEGSGQEGSGREGSGRDQGSGPTLTSVATRTSATDGPAQCEAHTKADEARLSELRRAKVLYLGGTALFFTSTFVVFGAMSLAPASILAPIESVQFVANVAFARCVNKQHISAAGYISSLVIVGGISMAVASGNHVNKSLGPAELEKYWMSTKWIVYLACVVVFAGVAQLVWVVYERRSRGKGGRELPHTATVLPVLYALSSSMIGSISVLQAKCISELLETLSGGTNIWDSGMTYLVIGLFLSTVIFWLFRLNAALAKYDALFIIPAIQAGYIFWATLSAGMYFQEFDCLEAYQLALFAIGICIMFAGLFVLSAEAAKVAKKSESTREAPSNLAALANGAPATPRANGCNGASNGASSLPNGASHVGKVSPPNGGKVSPTSTASRHVGAKAVKPKASGPDKLDMSVQIFSEHACGGSASPEEPPSPINGVVSPSGVRTTER